MAVADVDLGSVLVVVMSVTRCRQLSDRQ